MRSSNNKIFVTSPSLPPLQEYTAYLEGVWDRKILTHNGPLVQQLENELSSKLTINNLVLVTNGTIAIQLAIKALDLTGSEIITTPFTWIATSSAIMWEHCIPKFVDIDPYTFNIDPNRIEDAITNNTKAILGVHVFSNPCNVEALQSIAKQHNLKIIYDAAHSMCVNYDGSSILNYGDISATSFHATKIFNTGEGGGCATNDEYLYTRLRRLRFFGHNDDKDIVDVGCNGKMTEIHAALGLANLKYLDNVLLNRKDIYNLYHSNLCDIEYINFQSFPPDSYNYSYMPVVFDSEERLINVKQSLENNNIFARRYFRPALNTISCIFDGNSLEISERTANTILCLPTYDGLPLDIVDDICKIIIESC